ncbi:MAG: methionyl-tRNA formyltransferase [Chloroflexi bacterium]|nr:methionyl-tRNA formyltransferase [Chloroflexota bacterium]|tara:strand:+ start:1119 stop:2054 length:936 start_codon:yes stop_codon:yes gene_type:complete
MKLVFFGSSENSAEVLKFIISKKYNIEIIVTRKRKPKGRGLKLISNPLEDVANQNKIKLLETDDLNDPNVINELKSLKPDIFLIVSFGKLLSQKILDIPLRGVINIHPSLLPLYRGPSPISSVILDGVKQTGVTIMLLDKGIDTGPILIQSDPVMLFGNETTSELSKDLFLKGSELLVEILDKYYQGKVNFTEQDHKFATYTNLIKANEGEINWQENADYIFKRYRAFDKWPGIFTFWKGKRIKLIELEIFKNNFQKIKPGNIILYDKNLLIGTGSCPLRIFSLQLEGKKISKSFDFVRGYKEILNQTLPS